MNETQLEVLKKIEAAYLEISRITSQMDLEKDEDAQNLNQREKLLQEIESLKNKQNTLPLGATEEQIKETENRIKSLVLAILAESDMLMEQGKVLHASMKEEISKLSTASKAAQSYAAYRK